MNLKNPFPLQVRLIYLYNYECWICGQNGTQTGGMELHHILGRVSNSAFNSSPLCNRCHSHIGHSFEEEKELMQKTARYLVKHDYQFENKDFNFYEEHEEYYN